MSSVSAKQTGELEDDDVKKRRISGVRDSDEADHTRPTARPPANVTAELIARVRDRGRDDEGTMPGQPSKALLTAEDEDAIEAARKAYAESLSPVQLLPRDEFEDLIELLQEDLVEEDPYGGLIPIEEESPYGHFDPNAVPHLGTWSELGRLCLGGRAVMLLGLVDGKATIAEVVETSGLPLDEAIGILVVLMEHGAIDIPER